MTGEKFHGVEDTLFIPLASRVAISRRFPDYFYDEKSMELSDLDQVKEINEKSSEYSQMASVCRYYNVDKMARKFILANPGANIINLGVGLETMNYRLKDLDADFYCVDFPDVIDNRKLVLGQADRETLIGCDITDMAWTEKIDRTKACLIIFSGVLQYFKKEGVLKLFADIKERFENVEVIFDATNEVGIKYAQKYVKKTGNTSAMMYFYVNDAEEFSKEVDGQFIEVRGFFDVARKTIGKQCKLYTRIAMKVADENKRTILVHLKLN